MLENVVGNILKDRDKKRFFKNEAQTPRVIESSSDLFKLAKNILEIYGEPFSNNGRSPFYLGIKPLPLMVETGYGDEKVEVGLREVANNHILMCCERERGIGKSEPLFDFFEHEAKFSGRKDKPLITVEEFAGTTLMLESFQASLEARLKLQQLTNKTELAIITTILKNS